MCIFLHASRTNIYVSNCQKNRIWDLDLHSAIDWPCFCEANLLPTLFFKDLIVKPQDAAGLTSTSLLLATSEKFSCCSRVLSTLSSVIQKHRNLASMGSCDLAKTTNLAIYGTQIISLYTCDAKETDSWICRQSISQNLQKERKPVT